MPVDTWTDVAAAYAEDLAGPVADRAEHRRAAVRILAERGLTTLLGPARHGGAEQPWSVADDVTRTIAQRDPEIAELIGRHYVWYWLAEFIGTDEKIDHIGTVSTRARWFYSGAADPHAADLTVTDDGEAMVFDGRIEPAVGADVSTITILQGVRPDVPIPISALAYTSHAGLAVPPGTPVRVEVSAADIPWTGALGHVGKRFRPRPYNGLLGPTLDLVLAHVGVGALQARVPRGPGSADRDLADAVDRVARHAARTSAQAQELHDHRRELSEADATAHGGRVAGLASQVSALAADVHRAVAGGTVR